jgi:protein-arginine kinase activator protein McsA
MKNYRGICKNCGSSFNGRSKKRVYCSDVCCTEFNRKLKPEQSRKYSADYYEKRKTEISEQRKQKRKEDPRITKDKKLKLRYNISIDDYEKMLENQLGLCKICHQSNQKLLIDHDHKTGKIRGLLCNGCNRGLGYFNENILALKEAIIYLVQSND